ncbi:MAG: hypothetical protein WD270_00880 [Acetobacterales bacterium]
MLECRTISVSVARDWRDLYERIRRPEAFPEWASGLADASLARTGDGWTAQGPEGPVRIVFTPRNDYGVMDHGVHLPGGRVVQVPMRVVRNGEGAEVMLTQFRQPGMGDETFERDAEWIRRDLDALKALAERG